MTIIFTLIAIVIILMIVGPPIFYGSLMVLGVLHIIYAVLAGIVRFVYGLLYGIYDTITRPFSKGPKKSAQIKPAQRPQSNELDRLYQIYKLKERYQLVNSVQALRNRLLDPNPLIVNTPYISKYGMGAMIDLTKSELLNNKKMIKAGYFTRSNEERQLANVPGWDLVKKYNKGSGQARYHRTHLLPFRFALSEGVDVPRLLFPGTAMLNSGSNPLIGYRVEDNGFMNNEERQEKIAVENREYRLVEGLNRKTLTDVYLDQDDTLTLSLDDFERYADQYIYSYSEDSNHLFRYGVLTHGKEMEIPKAVDVFLIDLKNNKVVFYVTLPNIEEEDVLSTEQVTDSHKALKEEVSQKGVDVDISEQEVVPQESVDISEQKGASQESVEVNEQEVVPQESVEVNEQEVVPQESVEINEQEVALQESVEISEPKGASQENVDVNEQKGKYGDVEEVETDQALLGGHETIVKYQRLLLDGIITAEEFSEIKKKIINKI